MGGCSVAAPTMLALWGLIAVAGGLAHRTGRRSGWGLWLRLLVLSVVVLALSRPTVDWAGGDETVVYLVDTSASVGTDALAGALSEIDGERTAHSGLVTFAGAATVHGRPGTDWATPEDLAASGHRTDLSRGLTAALGLMPAGEPGRVVVFSDGHWSDDPEDVRAIARDRGVAIETRTMTPEASDPALGRLALDSSIVAPGATLSGTVVIHGGDAGFSGIISIAAGGGTVTEIPVTVAAQTSTTVPFEISLPPGLSAADNQVTATLGDDALQARFGLTRPPRVLIVGDAARDTARIASILEAEQFQVRQVSAAEAAPPLDGIDLIVLVDTPTRSTTGRPTLSTAFVAAVEPYVQAGGGLVTVGGEHAYELGGWHKSALGDLLPVRMDPDGALKDDAVSMVIVLDKSGSMARAAGTLGGAVAMMGSVTARFHGGRPEGSKIRLASEGAIAALERLRDVDHLGVLAVDSEAHWIVPLGQATGRAEKIRKISSISAGGGGMFVVTGLQKARTAILDQDTPLRHIILFADTGDAGEKEAAPSPEGGASETAFGIAQGLARADVTLSVIGIGAADARDTAFLKDLARHGGGRFHRTQDPKDIPALFSQETEELLGTGLEESGPISVRMERWHSILEGIDWAEAPALLGHNITHRRPQARVALASASGAPLLAIWRVGLGEVVAVTTDASPRWAANWLTWPGFSRLWTQTARHLAAPGPATDLSIEVAPDGAGMSVLVERRGADGLSTPIQGLTVHAVAADRVPIPMDMVEPGRWIGHWRPDPGSFWDLEVRDRNGQRLGGRGVAVPTSAESAHRGVNTGLLASLNVATGTASPPGRPVPLQPWLLFLAALILVVDAFARKHMAAARRVVGSGDAGIDRLARTVGGVRRARRRA
jgi:Ca-activated chloride channel family protein